MKRVLSVDPLTKSAEIATDDGEGGLIITTTQDCTDIIENNKAQYAQTDERKKYGDWDKVASIPLAVFQDLNKLGICQGFAVTDQKKFKEWLNNPENRYFRTRPGRV
jgi:hypothetical protein